jgi:hypothetical protein
MVNGALTKNVMGLKPLSATAQEVETPEKVRGILIRKIESLN